MRGTRADVGDEEETAGDAGDAAHWFWRRGSVSVSLDEMEEWVIDGCIIIAIGMERSRGRID